MSEIWLRPYPLDVKTGHYRIVIGHFVALAAPTCVEGIAIRRNQELCCRWQEGEDLG